MGKDVALERIVNLTFAFLRAETQGRHYISADWVIKHVDGYAKILQARSVAMLLRINCSNAIAQPLTAPVFPSKQSLLVRKLFIVCAPKIIRFLK